MKKLYHYVQPGVVLLPLMLSLDEATVDGNGRKSLIPVWLSFLNLRGGIRHKAWARQLIGYMPKFNKARWPKDTSKEARQELKRLVRAEALRKMLHAINVLGMTGVKMELPGRDGKWATVTVVPIIAYLSVDNKEAKALTHVKDAYRAMRAFCVQCVLEKQKYCFITVIAVKQWSVRFPFYFSYLLYNGNTVSFCFKTEFGHTILK